MANNQNKIDNKEYLHQTIDEIFLLKLKDAGVHLSYEHVGATVSRGGVRIFLRDVNEKGEVIGEVFGSDISISSTYVPYGKPQVNRINYPSSGAFSPSDYIAFNRVVMVNSLLTHWEPVCAAVDDACNRVRDLYSYMASTENSNNQ